mmetsp:Transcript_37214/g.78984  ORF Transcript_37214/g.78984 Transcript_37214/m.78984 type:complete len:332 (+) Transcript_37214:1663-2658(+)
MLRAQLLLPLASILDVLLRCLQLSLGIHQLCGLRLKVDLLRASLLLKAPQALLRLAQLGGAGFELTSCSAFLPGSFRSEVVGLLSCLLEMLLGGSNRCSGSCNLPGCSLHGRAIRSREGERWHLVHELAEAGCKLFTFKTVSILVVKPSLPLLQGLREPLLREASVLLPDSELLASQALLQLLPVFLPHSVVPDSRLLPACLELVALAPQELPECFVGHGQSLAAGLQGLASGQLLQDLRALHAELIRELAAGIVLHSLPGGANAQASIAVEALHELPEERCKGAAADGFAPHRLRSRVTGRHDLRAQRFDARAELAAEGAVGQRGEVLQL